MEDTQSPHLYTRLLDNLPWLPKDLTEEKETFQESLGKRVKWIDVCSAPQAWKFYQWRLKTLNIVLLGLERDRFLPDHCYLSRASMGR